MILDGHIHIHGGSEGRADLPGRLQAAGVDGGVLISESPACFHSTGSPCANAERLDGLMAWVAAGPELYALYWIDPLEVDAIDQVAAAVQRGVSGFKVICDRYYPGDDRAMAVFRAISRAGKPILFHSGILWDGKPSSVYNRPAGFESLLDVEGLRFCLAHISWPWCDELIAVYGKFQNAYSGRPDLSVEMFVDVTPGTPPIYRREALTKLFTVGYDIEHNVVFGSDCRANDYNVDWVRQWIRRDNEILSELGLSARARDGIYVGNLRRFLGVSPAGSQKRPLRAGE